jgi:hypothetical protein
MEASRSEGTHVAGQGDARRAREDFGEIWEAYFPSPWRWDRHVTGLISGPGQTSQSGCWLILARGEQRGTAREPCPNAWQCIPSQPTQLRGLVSRRRWEVFNVMLRSDVFFFGQQPMSCFWWRMALGAEWETLVVEMHVAPPGRECRLRRPVGRPPTHFITNRNLSTNRFSAVAPCAILSWAAADGPGRGSARWFARFACPRLV